jgi:uncharacterized Zn-binding protein involved in type VI secretion
MPAVSRIGDTISTGHGCASTTTLTGPSGDVFADNLGVEREGDPTVVHALTGRGCSVTHAAAINAGSSSVFVNNKPIARESDALADGGVISSSSTNVFANN